MPAFFKLLFDISTRGTSVLIATHNCHMIKKFPGRVVRLERGKVVG